MTLDTTKPLRCACGAWATHKRGEGPWCCRKCFETSR